MATAIIEDTAARADLEAILEGIAEQSGLRMAVDVAQTVKQAAVEGRMDGRQYVACDCGVDGCEGQAVCVIGHIALALNSFTDEGGVEDIPVVPNWDYHKDDISPIEHLVEYVRPGHTPQNNSYLRTLVHWLDSWLAVRTIGG